MTTNETSIEVTRVIDASTKDIFDVLSNPQRHADIDGTGTVVSDSKTDRIQKVGDVFTMNMNGEHMGGEYQTDNHVTGYDENKLIAWQTAPAGEEPGGWQWVYTLEAIDEGSTNVTLTYDWAKVTDKKLLGLFPLFSEDQLENSLNNLASAVAN